MTCAEEIMWADLVCRYLVKSGHNRYWAEIVRDMLFRRETIVAKLGEQIEQGCARLGGMAFEGRCLFKHLDEVLDDEKTLVALLPPTVSGGFEKFFETGGRITWNQPDYTVFEAATVQEALRERFADASATVILYEQAKQGETILEPVYVKVGVGKTRKDTGAMRSLNLYFESNRAEMVKSWSQGSKIVRTAGVLEGGGWRPGPRDMTFHEGDTIQVVPLTKFESFYWRALWTHRFRPTAGGVNGLGVLVNGWLVGVMGFNFERLMMGRYGQMEDNALLQFGMADRVDGWRMGRLLWKLSIQHGMMELAMEAFENRDLYLGRIRTVRTAVFSRYPESKEMRGIYKMINRLPMAKPEYGLKKGFRLTYEASVETMSKEEVLEWWRTKEVIYRAQKS